MKKGIDCQAFEEQLDACLRGDLPEGARHLLREHGSSCPDCSALLGMQEHLARPTLAELEESVPADLLATVWPAVRAGIAGATAAATKEKAGVGPGRRATAAWVPALAAACLILLLANGLLLSELREARGRDPLWSRRTQDRGSPTVGARPAGTEGRSPAAGWWGEGQGWASSLAGREELSVAELRTLLERVPPSTTVLTAAQAEALLRAARLRAPASWQAATGKLRTQGGIRAAHLLSLLDALDLPPDRSLPLARLRDLLS